MTIVISLVLSGIYRGGGQWFKFSEFCASSEIIFARLNSENRRSALIYERPRVRRKIIEVQCFAEYQKLFYHLDKKQKRDVSMCSLCMPSEDDTYKRVTFTRLLFCYLQVTVELFAFFVTKLSVDRTNIKHGKLLCTSGEHYSALSFTRTCQSSTRVQQSLVCLDITQFEDIFSERV